MYIPSLLTYEESERDDRSRLTSMKRRGLGSFQVGARKMVLAPTWEVVPFVTNGCAAHHREQKRLTLLQVIYQPCKSIFQQAPALIETAS